MFSTRNDLARGDSHQGHRSPRRAARGRDRSADAAQAGPLEREGSHLHRAPRALRQDQRGGRGLRRRPRRARRAARWRGSRDGAAGRQALDAAGVPGGDQRPRSRRGGGERAGGLRQAGPGRHRPRQRARTTGTPPISSPRSRAASTSGYGSWRRISRPIESLHKGQKSARRTSESGSSPQASLSSGSARGGRAPAVRAPRAEKVVVGRGIVLVHSVGGRRGSSFLGMSLATFAARARRRRPHPVATGLGRCCWACSPRRPAPALNGVLLTHHMLDDVDQIFFPLHAGAPVPTSLASSRWWFLLLTLSSTLYGKDLAEFPHAGLHDRIGLTSLSQ